MVTVEQVMASYQRIIDTGATFEEAYYEAIKEIAELRNALEWSKTAVVPIQEVTRGILPAQEYNKAVYVKIKGKPHFEVHNYVNNVEEDNAAIINNVKAQLKEDKVDVVSVFIAEKI